MTTTTTITATTTTTTDISIGILSLPDPLLAKIIVYACSSVKYNNNDVVVVYNNNNEELVASIPISTTTNDVDDDDNIEKQAEEEEIERNISFGLDSNGRSPGWSIQQLSLVCHRFHNIMQYYAIHDHKNCGEYLYSLALQKLCTSKGSSRDYNDWITDPRFSTMKKRYQICLSVTLTALEMKKTDNIILASLWKSLTEEDIRDLHVKRGYRIFVDTTHMHGFTRFLDSVLAWHCRGIEVRGDTVSVCAELLEANIIHILKNAHQLAIACAEATGTYPQVTAHFVLQALHSVDWFYNVNEFLWESNIPSDARQNILNRMCRRAGLVSWENDIVPLFGKMMCSFIDCIYEKCIELIMFQFQCPWERERNQTKQYLDGSGQRFSMRTISPFSYERGFLIASHGRRSESLLRDFDRVFRPSTALVPGIVEYVSKFILRLPIHTVYGESWIAPFVVTESTQSDRENRLEAARIDHHFFDNEVYTDASDDEDEDNSDEEGNTKTGSNQMDVDGQEGEESEDEISFRGGDWTIEMEVDDDGDAEAEEFHRYYPSDVGEDEDWF